jgi:hypothetical protein
MKKILYLCDKNTYNSKMSRVRFHGIEKLGEVANVTWTGPSWKQYNNSLSVQENIEQLFPNQQFDLVVAYNGKDLKDFSKVTYPTCIRYNEMYDKKITFNDIMLLKPNIVICHHHNDFLEYKQLFKSFNLFPVKFFNIPHSAEKTIFKDYGEEKKYDLMIGGAIGVRSSLGQHYPLRDRLVGIVSSMSKDYRCHIHKHPGYLHSDAYTNKYLIDFAKEINAAKICVTCSGKPKSRFGKYIEIPMSATAIAADIPDEHPDEFRKFVIELDMKMTDEEIANRLAYYVDNNEARQNLIEEGLKYASNYTQEKYAERFLKIMEDEL